MKITSVDTIPIRVPLKKPKSFALRTVGARDYTIVRINTDEGLSGWGYNWGPCVVAKITEDLLVPHLIDQDPRRIEYLWDKMYRQNIVWGRRGLILRGISAIDIALWDLMGKITGQPIHRILGGFRTQVPAYYSGGYYLSEFQKESDYLNYLEDEFTTFRDRGFTAFKMKFGATDLSTDLARVRLARDIVGDTGLLMIDANCAYRLDQAVRVAGKLEPYEPEWLEEPLNPDDIDGLAQLRARTTIPIATGENHYTRWEFQNMLDRDAVDVIQGDPIIMGGITEFLKLHGMVSASHVSLAPHDSHNVNVHVGAALPKVTILEYFSLDSDIFNFDVFIENPVQPANGYLKPHDEPGHGLILDEKALEKFAL